MQFEDLRLAAPIVRAVADEGYTTPTPIQAGAIPPALEGQDVLGCAQTGTGKTGAFALPTLNQLASRRPKGRRTPRALVLCPTRELATQIAESFQAYGRHLPIRGVTIFGGVSQVPQVRKLRHGVDVIVATPGRLLDLMNQGEVDLHQLEMLILDEADRMLDMGFIHDIRRIVKHVPDERQTLFFSATMPPPIRRLADALLTDPVSIEVARVSSTAEAIEQRVFHVNKKNKAVLLQRLLNKEDMDRTLIFTRTKYGADKLVKVLNRAGTNAAAIHGNKSQNARTRALAGFKSGKTRVLVATDIASRGIDVDEISHVINFDIPHEPETYVHRIGRTARAGSSGTALSFCDHDEVGSLHAIERLIKEKISIRDCEPDLLHDAPERGRPARPGGRRNGGGGGGGRRNGGGGGRRQGGGGGGGRRQNSGGGGGGGGRRSGGRGRGPGSGGGGKPGQRSNGRGRRPRRHSVSS